MQQMYSMHGRYDYSTSVFLFFPIFRSFYSLSSRTIYTNGHATMMMNVVGVTTRTTTSIFLAVLIAILHLDHATGTINPTLPFGDINVLVLTDTHSWVGGHARQESPKLTADYGDVLSLYKHLKQHCDEQGNDLWFVMNGDWIDGTGLAQGGDPSSLLPLLQKMPWDAVNCGNHELYKDSVVEYVQRPGGFIDWWGGRYLTSNIHKTSDGTPLGKRYKVLHGKNANVLVFGFIYNMEDPCDEISVSNVEKEVKEKWFQNALKNEDYDAVLVLAHMDHEDSAVHAIRQAIRGITNKPKLPIQFITGHTHIRAVSYPDDYSSSFEAGRYLDTVGFVSFPTYANVLNGNYMTRMNTNAGGSPGGDVVATVPPSEPSLITEPSSVNGTTFAPTTPVATVPPQPQQNPTTTTPPGNPMFQNVFMDANIGVFRKALGNIEKQEFDTEDGLELSKFIYHTQQKMGLLEEIGCADKDYLLNATLDDDASLWGLFQREVGPFWFEADVENFILLLSKDTWRYDLRSALPLVLDDLIAVAPFNDTAYHMGEFEGEVIKELVDTLNLFDKLAENSMIPYDRIPSYVMVGNLTDQDVKYHLYTYDWSVKKVQETLQSLLPTDEKVNPTATTFSSTLMWVKYALEKWPCPGDQPQMHLPDWFPTQDTVTGDDDDKVRRAVAIVLAVIVVLFIGVAITCFFMFFRYLCCSGHTAVSQSELDAFTMDSNHEDHDEDDYDEDEDVYDMGNDYDTEKTNGGSNLFPDDQNDNELL